jgi:hypothetical protein
MREASVSRLVRALELLRKPRGNQSKFLQAHYDSPGRASTATILANMAEYKSFRGINLRYGILAENIAKKVGHKGHSFAMVCDWAKTDTITNAHCVLIMRPNFAKALQAAGWVTG